MEKTPKYEAPTLEVVGTLHEITKQGAQTNSDVANGPGPTAFGPGKSF